MEISYVIKKLNQIEHNRSQDVHFSLDFNQDSSVCPPNVGGCLNIFTLILFYSQFWLNLPTIVDVALRV
jgi:hypothetical protein